MKKTAIALFFVLASGPAFAQAIPAAILDKEYGNCISQPANGHETQQKAYCMCLRNKMAAWSIDTYVRLAKEVASDGAKSPTLEAVTKECFNSVQK